MDTTPEYIKMCEKAGEIQEQRIKQVAHGKDLPLVEGDYVWEGNQAILISDDSRNISQYDQHRPKFSISTAGYCEGAGYEVDSLVWLPRQDQLQEMVHFERELKFEYGSWAGWSLEYTNNYKIYKIPHNWGSHYPLDSLEQLWLAFVMKEKYQKAWNGEDWKPISPAL